MSKDKVDKSSSGDPVRGNDLQEGGPIYKR